MNKAGANPFSEAERNALRPMPFWLPIDYAEARVVVGADSPAPGLFRRKTMPILESVINSIIDPRYERVVGMAGTQSGKSQSLNQIPLAYFLEYQRMSTGFAIPNQKLAKRVNKTKLKPMFEECESLARLIPQDGAGSRGGFPSELVLTNGAQWFFLGAGSAADMAQATFPMLIVDETDKADKAAADGKEANPIYQLIQRTSAHEHTRRLIFTCTVTSKTGYINTAYEAGTKGRPFVRCPHCGEWFCMEWDWERNQLAWDDDTDALSCEETAYYPCPHCEARLRDDERLLMLRQPLWVHEGESIERCSLAALAPRPDSEGNASVAAGWPEILRVEPLAPFQEQQTFGDYCFRVAGDRKRSRQVSWWWNKLYSPFTTLGKLAARARSAKNDGQARHSICIYDQALPWEDDISDELSTDAQSIMNHSEYADYQLGVIPFQWDAHCALTVGVDIHSMWATWLVDAWRFDAEGYLLDSWLIDMPRTKTTFGQVGYPYPSRTPNRIYGFLEQVLRPLCLGGWKDITGSVVQPKLICIDSGFQDDSKKRRVEPHDRQVYAFCRRYGQAQWRAIKGTPGLDGVMPFEIKKQGGEGNKVFYVLLDTDILKTEVLEQEEVKQGGAGVRYIPRNTPAYYGRGMAAEKRVIQESSSNRLESKWDQQDRENHPFDTRVYSWSAARQLGIKPPVPVVIECE